MIEHYYYSLYIWNTQESHNYERVCYNIVLHVIIFLHVIAFLEKTKTKSYAKMGNHKCRINCF